MKTVVLSRLLDKYENSKHLFEPGTSNKRVMLRIGNSKKELPEYVYEDASIRDAFNDVAKALEIEGLITTEWVKGRPVLSGLCLNLERVMDCYRLIDREHPKELAIEVASLVKERLSEVSTSWIIAWRNEVYSLALETYRVPAYCKKELHLLEDLLKAFKSFDALHGEAITMRAFSSKCYHDTKYFERNVREHFLRIAQKYNEGFRQVCEQNQLGIREQLAYLGIYARPELYELSGDIVIHTAIGSIDFHASNPYGLALPSTVIDHITVIDLSHIRRITFIENKTNYGEYLLTESQPQELVIYHGGFLSPQKRALFSKINKALHTACEVFFWADIDLGGFQMYEQLQRIIPSVTPFRMSGQDVSLHHHHGLTRSTEYLNHLRNSPYNQAGSPFEEAILKIHEFGVTIEQEVFLLDCSAEENK